MAIAGTHAGRAVGIKGPKVKILRNKMGEPRRRLPKEPLPEIDETDLQKQSTIYLRERNKQMRAKRLTAEMELAAARGDLIEKELVTRQLAFILIAFRQSVLAWPSRLRAAIGAEFTHEMAQKARSLAHETLKHLEKLPETVQPNWLELLEE